MQIAEFEIEVEKKSIKNVHLAVYPPDGRVHVSVPERMPDDELGLFLFSKLSWIRQSHEQVIKQLRQSEREYVSGESHYFLGRRYLLKVFQTTEKVRVEKKVKFIELYVRDKSSIDKKRALFEDFYRSQLSEVLSKMVDKWSKIMEEDSIPFSWSILHMQQLWGNCQTEKRAIRFNLLLARLPKRCIEYVVVHELAHLKVHRHDKNFSAILDKYMPDWSARKKELDEFIALSLN